MNKRDPSLEGRKRKAMAYLLATNPEAFEIIADNHVNLFHGTQIKALPNILKYGMCSQSELVKRGITISSGEGIGLYQDKRKLTRLREFISFTDWLGMATSYAERLVPSSLSLKERKKIEPGMLIGISVEDIKSLRMKKISSDVLEDGIFDSIPLEYIKFIGVPENKVKSVRKLVNNDKIKVTGIDFEELNIALLNDEHLTKMIEKRKQKERPKIFGADQVKTLAEGRKTSSIIMIYRNIKNKIKNRGKENGNNAKEK